MTAVLLRGLYSTTIWGKSAPWSEGSGAEGTLSHKVLGASFLALHTLQEKLGRCCTISSPEDASSTPAFWVCHSVPCPEGTWTPSCSSPGHLSNLLHSSKGFFFVLFCPPQTGLCLPKPLKLPSISWENRRPQGKSVALGNAGLKRSSVQLKALAALLENLGSVPNSHVTCLSTDHCSHSRASGLHWHKPM